MTKKKKSSESEIPYFSFKQRIQDYLNDVPPDDIVELNKLYWDIGNLLHTQQEQLGWKKKDLEQVGAVLQEAFPSLKGFSKANILRMKDFFQSYEEAGQLGVYFHILPIFHISWAHNTLLMDLVEDCDERLWLAQRSIESRWSRAELLDKINSGISVEEDSMIADPAFFLPFAMEASQEKQQPSPYVALIYNLGRFYAESNKSSSMVRAIFYFAHAGSRGHGKAQYNLAIALHELAVATANQEVHVQAFEWFKLAARQSIPRAFYMIGCYLFLNILPNVPNDQAVVFFKLAADKGVAEAQSNYGVCLLHGNGVDASDEEAAKQFRLAADQDDSSGQFNLGACYYYGRGVAMDKAQALHYIKLAAKQQHPKALDALKKLF